ncbi:bifunctional glutamate--cysteine ligase GshA/glutathione synthetase GshB [Tetragenococcus halophilus]|uniref:Glutathione biosynthesis bifunctional protein GshAB n=2 Tax=Tetragenococcus halophilus TaxID=51669 RepID=A0AAN1SJQ4_TETHN|nr:bifunctional glutamate--cysteine ligase GshA/glutathione synthetase GshB [Tetragenococcus halophilus]AOF49689.1 bifunctional glutamate--cysteine ligase/glutathione synthetase [Tetragenococcus halophilus]MCO7026118.1 bifunctional glutamate--cysteine ligase GshA/glutathione synthetase GshB [Tetragenococcus halophilus]MCO8286334.1 bifunctional glutamate--cysteine ligase GshA/glutathione synthetase GshB [Tetragenococcus halophilus]MCO8291840.1 bifunctional glutamate--cysteine ligase GshA/glutath
MNVKPILTNKQLKPYLLKARYGVEKESQRVTKAGDLVATDYPKTLGNRSFHPYIQTDFAETQMELVTPITDSITELFDWLAAIHDTAYRSMDSEEMLWPMSMPPALPEVEENIVIAKLDNFEDVLYRRFLAMSYGRRKQMVSGIHFNFEFDDEMVRKMFELQDEYKNYHQFKSEVYLKVTRNYLHYRWFATYFFAASPLSGPHYFNGHERPEEPVRSIRNSKYGYQNHDDVKVTYRSVEEYVADIQQMVEEGKLSEEKEFYAPVRLRGGKSVADLANKPVRYIELRNIDLDPYQPYGISKEEVEFFHIFMLFLLWTDEKAEADEWVFQGDQLNELVSLESPLSQTACYDEAQKLLAEIRSFVAQTGLNVSTEILDHLEEMLEDPAKTLAGRIYLASKETSQKELAVQQGLSYYRKAWQAPYQLAGFTDMELSTQIFLFDAIQKGLQVEVLDRQDQFLKLTAQDHTEYVKNGNMTSKDTYITPLMMENKTVTKKLLQRAGFKVPQGKEFTDKKAAYSSYEEFRDKGIVVKPKSTNYGLGITVFKDGTNEKDYIKAIDTAFAEDSSVLVEEFLAGTEYRFFVVGDQVKAVLLRVPANVSGDGKHSIKELVDRKNDDPLRGENHRTPLEKIHLGQSEQFVLQEQGYQIDSIPNKGETIYLRDNSNVSTGGDSIDMTDAFTDDYKQIAVEVAQTLGAAICGIDMIITDINLPASSSDVYGIIEANFNPMMHMHCYPFEGKGRRLTMDILKLLYPDFIQRKDR